MPRIHMTTFIAAPVERVFDLSRHLALYKLIFQSRKEKLTSGAASTLVGRNETITIVAKHAGRARMMMMKITSFQRPSLFVEEQVKGDLQHYQRLTGFGLEKDLRYCLSVDVANVLPFYENEKLVIHQGQNNLAS